MPPIVIDRAAVGSVAAILPWCRALACGYERCYALDSALISAYSICMDDQTKDVAQTKRWTHHADNRARLIAAGRELLAGKGIEATTVKEIARLAGVSPGLFHYYFASKDELLLAVLYDAGAQFKQQLLHDLQAAMASRSFPVAAIVTAHELGQKDPTWYRLRYELYALGLRHPRLQPAVATFLATARHEIAQTIQALTGMPEARAHAIAAVLLACMDGLALQQLVQPDLNLTTAYAFVQQLLADEPQRDA
jgi:AcrR family transcriptional regulator